MYLAAGRADTARVTLTRLMEHHPDYPGGYYNLGNICRTDGDLEAARNNYHLAISYFYDLSPLGRPQICIQLTFLSMRVHSRSPSKRHHPPECA